MSNKPASKPAPKPLKTVFQHEAGGGHYGGAPSIWLTAERLSGGAWHMRLKCSEGGHPLRNTRQAWADALRELAHYVERLPEE